jgi:proteasome lid subunit RPN8/RPN11
MIVLEPRHLKQLVDAAEAAWPAECCGLLVGAGDPDRELRVARVVASPNLARGRDGRPARRRFEIDPALRLALERELRGGPQRVIGHYHSHPGRPAQPSRRDLDAAWEPDLVWLITAVVDGQAIHTTAHRLTGDGDRFLEIPLRTADWHAAPTRAPPPDFGDDGLSDLGRR